MARAILSGHLCDTETAKEIGWWCNDFTPNDFNYVLQKLYKNKAGYYFLSTYHAVWHGNSGGMLEELVFLEDTEAQKWAERKLTPEKFAEAFGIPSENPRITITLTPQIRKKLEDLRSKRNQTFTAIISDLIDKAE